MLLLFIASKTALVYSLIPGQLSFQFHQLISALAVVDFLSGDSWLTADFFFPDTHRCTK